MTSNGVTLPSSTYRKPGGRLGSRHTHPPKHADHLSEVFEPLTVSPCKKISEDSTDSKKIEPALVSRMIITNEYIDISYVDINLFSRYRQNHIKKRTLNFHVDYCIRCEI